jgi:hypothetical protein
MGTALETRARRQPWLLAILLCAAVQGISSYTSLPIFFSGSGRTAPVKKGKVELPPLHYLHDLHLPPIEPQKALEVIHTPKIYLLFVCGSQQCVALAEGV